MSYQHDPDTGTHTVATDFGILRVCNELPGTVSLSVADGLGAERMVILQVEEVYDLIDALTVTSRTARVPYHIDG